MTRKGKENHSELFCFPPKVALAEVWQLLPGRTEFIMCLGQILISFEKRNPLKIHE
jgi:hypothetical protein